MQFISGVVLNENITKIKRMIFRASKGRACIETFDMENTNFSDPLEIKKIFLIVFPSSEENILMNKLLKICDIFNTSRYKVPSINEFNIEYPDLLSEIKQKESILNESKSTIKRYITEKLGEVSSFSLFLIILI